MQVFHQTQRNLSKSQLKNTCLRFWQFWNNFFEITYSSILNNRKKPIQNIRTKYCAYSREVNFTIILFQRYENRLVFSLLFYLVVKKFTITEFSRGKSKPCRDSRITAC